MADWLARYRSGEHQATWDEMRAAGERMSGDQLGQALQVSKLTIRNALANLVRIERGLRDLGYDYLSVAAAPERLGIEAAVAASGLEALASLPGLDPADLERMMNIVRSQMPAALGERVSPGPRLTSRRSAIGNPGTHQAELEACRGAVQVPMALADFWTIIGWVDFTGREDASAPARHEWQPMVVNPPMGLREDHEDFIDDNGKSGFQFELMPDPRFDDAIGSGDMIRVAMEFGADARLSSGEWFVDYLRRQTKAACILMPVGAPPAFRAGLERIRDGWEPF